MITVAPIGTPVTQICLNATFRKRKFYKPILNLAPFPPPSATALSCEELLADAERQYHLLLTGGQTASIHHDGRTQTFTRADRSALHSYVMSLRAQCGSTSSHGAGCRCSGCHPSMGRARSVNL